WRAARDGDSADRGGGPGPRRAADHARPSAVVRADPRRRRGPARHRHRSVPPQEKNVAGGSHPPVALHRGVHTPRSPTTYGGSLMSVLAPMIDRYLAGPDTLRQAVSGMTREQLIARPIAGKWSTLEVICHLADFEPILADRMKRVIAEDRPTLLGADEKRFAAALEYHQRDPEEELALIAQTRSQLARILRPQTDTLLKHVRVPTIPRPTTP